MKKNVAEWKCIQTSWLQQRLAQALLFVGPLHCDINDFTNRLAQLIHCKQKQKQAQDQTEVKNIDEPCLTCADCQMVARKEHPDLEWLKADKIGGAIKIDQIRALQQTVYLTPQRSHYRIIIIETADRMNTASANALLKILEEPAQHTFFILIAEQLNTILPTIRSRCQLIPFSTTDTSYADNLLMLGTLYPAESNQALIIEQAESILDGIIGILNGNEHPCILATQLMRFELSILLWFLYLVYAQMQYMHLKGQTNSGPAFQQLNRLSSLLDPILIFKQIDKINTLLKKISHNMNINQNLALEELLFNLG